MYSILLYLVPKLANSRTRVAPDVDANAQRSHLAGCIANMPLNVPFLDTGATYPICIIRLAKMLMQFENYTT